MLWREFPRTATARAWPTQRSDPRRLEPTLVLWHWLRLAGILKGPDERRGRPVSTTPALGDDVRLNGRDPEQHGQRYRQHCPADNSTGVERDRRSNRLGGQWLPTG